MNFKSCATGILLSVSLLAMPVSANDASVRASGGMSIASATVAGGSVLLASGTGELVVASVEAVGDVVKVVARGSADASEVTLEMSASLAGTLSLAAGSVVTAVAHSAGTVLTYAGQVIAFIPNELGRELLYRRRVGDGV